MQDQIPVPTPGPVPTSATPGPAVPGSAPVAAPPPSIVYISFSAEISPHTTESLLAVMANCVNQRVKAVYLMLSTPGGSVMNGLNLYNVLIGLPVELITHNVGNVDSIGNAVFLAGSKRYASPHSTFMFHGVGFDVSNRVRLEEKNLREHLDSIMSDQKRIGAIITERTNIGEEAVRALFRDAQTKDATFAASARIVHEIKDVQVPPGCNVISLVFQR